MNAPTPLVSVVSTNFNHGKFLRATLDSVLGQSYKNIQLIVVDGGSTDNSLEILKTYQGVEWTSEKDRGPTDAYYKGLERAKGKYILFCHVTDGYLDPRWIENCVKFIEQKPEISLVWGLPRYMDERGNLGAISYPQFHRKNPPQEENFFYYWLHTFFWPPEGNFCVRTEVFRKCFTRDMLERCLAGGTQHFDAWLEFNYIFQTKGYLTGFIRSIANYGRQHEIQRGKQERRAGIHSAWQADYFEKAKAYRRKILRRKIQHQFKDGEGNILPVAFSPYRYYLESFSPLILPDKLKAWIRPSR